MEHIEEKIYNNFLFLLSMGYKSKTVSEQGKIDARQLIKLVYENETMNRRVEITYCSYLNFSRLYGYLINTKSELNSFSDYQNYISFSKLSCAFNEGEEVKFWGANRWEMDNQLNEFKFILNKYESILKSNEWISYDEVLKNEKKIYHFSEMELNSWMFELKNNDFIKNNLKLIYDYTAEPEYECYALVFKDQRETTYQISSGYASRDDHYYTIAIKDKAGHKHSHDLLNKNIADVVSFIENIVKQ